MSLTETAIPFHVHTFKTNQQPKGLIGRAELALLPPDAIVVNVGRGAAVDEGALFDALRGKKVGRSVGDGLHACEWVQNGIVAG